MCFGTTAMIRTVNYEKGRALSSPVFYIDNESERIIGEEEWVCSHLHKYHLPGYNGNLLLEGIYENGEVQQVTVETKSIMAGKEISLYLMTELLPDFDDDLLYEAIAIIDYSP